MNSRHDFACAHADPRIGRWGIAPCDEGSKQMMDELTYGKNLGSTEAGQLVKIELAKRCLTHALNMAMAI